MVKRLSIVAAVIGTSLALSGVAIAAPPAMTLSSWEPTFEEEAVVGGVRTVTVTNIQAEPLSDLRVSLEPAPCDCAIVASTADTGALDGSVWVVGELAPGSTASITVSYDAVGPGMAIPLLPDPPVMLLVALGTVAALGLAIRERRQTAVAH